MAILIYTPTIGDGLRERTVASVEAQVTDIDYIWEVGYHNPFAGDKKRNVIAQYQRAWQMALAGGYEALLTVEHDMILPPQAIEYLMDTDAEVVYGVYLLRHGLPVLNAWQYVNNRCLGMTLSLYPKELARARRRGW